MPKEDSRAAQAQRDMKRLARIWDFIRGRPAYARDYARLRALLGGHTNWAAATGPHPRPTVSPSGVVERVLAIHPPRTESHLSRAALRAVQQIARRWAEIIGPELPDPALPVHELASATRSALPESCVSITIPFREGWTPGEDPVFANEIVIRIRPWASTHAVVQAYRSARREVLERGSGFAKAWKAAEADTRDPGGAARGERRSRDPEREAKIRQIHDLRTHDNPAGKHSFPWLAKKFAIAVSTAHRYNQLGQAGCPRCTPSTR